MQRFRRLGVIALLSAASAASVGTFAACDDTSSDLPRTANDDGGAPDAGTVTPEIVADAGGGIDCPKPTAGPTEHQGSVATETWTADKSPHIVTSDLTITGTLTIEPCAEVLIGEKHSIDINPKGKLVGEGLATKPIHIGARDPEKAFAQIRAGGGGTIRLAYATVDNGGDPLNSIVDVTGTINAQGVDGTQPTQPTIFVDHVTIAKSKSLGLYLIDGAGFAPGSQELTVTGAAQAPMSIWARAVGTVPSGKYTGNAYDEIVLPGSGGASAVQEDATMRDWGVPYRVGNSLSAGVLLIERDVGPGVATLTIEAGVTVRMKKGGNIQVQQFVNPLPAKGAIVVNGTAARPVVFTSAEPTPAAGDWLGIWFGLIPAANDKIDFARIEYAGGLSSSGSDACNAPGTNDAAIRIFGVPPGPFVTNTTIMKSAGHGIDRGWRDDARTDFLATNTFVDVAKCKESYPKDKNGACPATVPCP